MKWNVHWESGVSVCLFYCLLGVMKEPDPWSSTCCSSSSSSCRQLERQGQEKEHHWNWPSETPEGRLPQIQVRPPPHRDLSRQSRCLSTETLTWGRVWSLTQNKWCCLYHLRLWWFKHPLRWYGIKAFHLESQNVISKRFGKFCISLCGFKMSLGRHLMPTLTDDGPRKMSEHMN